jgi:hypothetical protein
MFRSYEFCGLFHVDDFVKGYYNPHHEQSDDYQTCTTVEGQAEQ